MHFSVAFAVSVLGVIGLRLTADATEKEEHKIEGDIQDLETGLKNLVTKLDALNANSDSVGVYEVHVRIDDEFIEDLEAFVDARESMIPQFGMQNYADIMSLFAGGERLINRAWSASADGYVDEVWKCLAGALEQMKSALVLLEQSQAEGGA